MKIAVYGAGAWGTALALAFNHRHQITLWSREADHVSELDQLRINHKFLPGFTLPTDMAFSHCLPSTANQADLHLIVTPLAGLRDTLRGIAQHSNSSTPILWACKGLEANTGKLPHQIVQEEIGQVSTCGALTGPSFAQEVAQGLPAAITLAAFSKDFAQQLSKQLHTPHLRIYANDDVIGAEIGGAVKNIMAIAAGIADGMGFGLNARAALITRGLAEIARLGCALGGRQETLMGLAGMGDLILTCTGDLSRNRKVGLLLAQGKSLAQSVESLGHVAEGVSTTREVAALADRLGVSMPICQAVNQILFHGLPAREAVEQLLARDPKVELE